MRSVDIGHLDVLRFLSNLHEGALPSIAVILHPLIAR